MNFIDALIAYPSQGRMIPVIIEAEALSHLWREEDGALSAGALIEKNHAILKACVEAMIDANTDWTWTVTITRQSMLDWGSQRKLPHWKYE